MKVFKIKYIVENGYNTRSSQEELEAIVVSDDARDAIELLEHNTPDYRISIISVEMLHNIDFIK